MHSIPRLTIPQKGEGGPEQALWRRGTLARSKGRSGMWVENLARDSIERREDQTAHSGAWIQSPVRQRWGWGWGRGGTGGRKGDAEGGEGGTEGRGAMSAW